MALAPGTRLGPYKIGAQIGVGGMGEVYRAQDTNLGRDVAIKVLPDAFAQDPERVARFEREAKTLASLNHPNIAIIHGLENARGVLALVMELVQGTTLADRIAHGPIAVDEALAIARQIAEAVEAAHEQGIIHRDLKPANVKVRDDGAVKVLDFGLAKTLEPVGATPSLSHSPTITTPAMTQAGVILGTAAYMSPEQAKGKPADKRSDVWAFGCVLYEMLTGTRAFDGENVTDTIAATLRGEPDWRTLPPNTPPLIKRLLHDCLIKERARRIADLSTVLFALRVAMETGPEPVRVALRWRRGLLRAGVAVVVIVAAFGGMLLSRQNDVHHRPVVSQIDTPGTSLFLRSPPSGGYAFALDPTGATLIFSGRHQGEPWRLYRRAMDGDAVVAIDGTDGAFSPFFSSDGQWLLFVQGSSLKRMPARGGAAQQVTEVPNFAGATFGGDGSLVFAPLHGGGLSQLQWGTNVSKQLTTVDQKADEAGHHWPSILPDGRHVLVTVEVGGKSYSEARIVLLSLDTGERRLLIDGGSDARYVPTGHIVYWRTGDLWAVPFDLARLEVVGTPVVVVRNVMTAEAVGQARYFISSEGTLFYMSGTDPLGEHALMRVDRRGATRALTTERRAFVDVVVSPDGARLATQISAANDSLWLFEFDRETLTRLTFEAEAASPTWSPDGKRLAFSRYGGGEVPHMYVMPIDGNGMPEPLHEVDGPTLPRSWSHNTLAFVRLAEKHDPIWVVQMSGDGKPAPFKAGQIPVGDPHLSHDGRWLAYVSNESGVAPEVYVRPFPGPGKRSQVSVGGGVNPRWRADDRELFYSGKPEKETDESALMVADVKVTAEISFSRPRQLFKRRWVVATGWDVFPDGQHFVFIEDLAQPRSSITMVQNWFDELKGLVPAK
jgi:protein kinase-like protein/WD40 repeat protein